MSRFAIRPEDLLSLAEIAGMSGLEFIQGMAEGRLPGPPIARTLGFFLESAERGTVTFRGTPSFDVMNPIGTVHGGWYGTLLDSCMACAVQTELPRGTGYTTLEFKVSILRPMTQDSDPVLAIGKTVHVGRRTGVAEGRIVGAEDGRIYATGTTTCLVMPLT